MASIPTQSHRQERDAEGIGGGEECVAGDRPVAGLAGALCVTGLKDVLPSCQADTNPIGGLSVPPQLFGVPLMVGLEEVC